jgi:hypothetical protein
MPKYFPHNWRESRFSIPFFSLIKASLGSILDYVNAIKMMKSCGLTSFVNHASSSHLAKATPLKIFHYLKLQFSTIKLIKE